MDRAQFSIEPAIGVKVTYVTTLNHNPGDEFIRMGIEHVLGRVFEDIEPQYIHKHDPRSIFTTWKGTGAGRVWHWRTAGIQYSLYRSVRRPSALEDKVLNADMLVFAGAPYIWRQRAFISPSSCANAEWVKPVWGRAARVAGRIPVLNLAAGSSLDSEAEGEELLADSRCRRFLTWSAGLCDALSVRDQVAASVLRRLEIEAPVIPCSSILCSERLGIRAARPEYVVINYSRGIVPLGRGRHAADPAVWRNVMREVAAETGRSHRVIFVCHTPHEARHVREDLGDVELFESMDPVKLLKLYSGALGGICNRVHSAAALAAFGRPALTIGGDTRSELLREFGLPILHADEATAERIRAEIARMLRDVETYQRTLIGAKRAALDGYTRLVENCALARRRRPA